MTKAEQRFESYAARVGKHWTDAERADARRGVLDAIADGEAELARARNSESYAPPASRADADVDQLYLDEAAWAAHLASLHGKTADPLEAGHASGNAEPKLVQQ